MNIRSPYHELPDGRTGGYRVVVRRHEKFMLFGLQEGHGPLLLEGVRAVMLYVAQSDVARDALPGVFHHIR